MKKYMFVLMVVLVLSACTAQTGTPLIPGSGQTIKEDAILADTKWSLISFSESGSETAILDESAITLDFTADGQAAGSGGCNGYNAKYEVQGNQITFSEITSTLLACEADSLNEQEQRYFQALMNTGKFELTDETLTIWFNDDLGMLNWHEE